MALLVVRELRNSEWPTYRNLRLESLLESPDAFGSIYEMEAIRTESEWQQRLVDGINSELDLPLVAQYDEQPAGLAWAQIEENKPDTANLYQMWVDPRFRGKSIGTELLLKYKEWAVSSGATSLYLDVTINNSGASDLYSSFGFVSVGAPEPLRRGSILKVQPMSMELTDG